MNQVCVFRCRFSTHHSNKLPVFFNQLLPIEMMCKRNVDLHFKWRKREKKHMSHSTETDFSRSSSARKPPHPNNGNNSVTEPATRAHKTTGCFLFNNLELQTLQGCKQRKYINKFGTLSNFIFSNFLNISPTQILNPKM